MKCLARKTPKDGKEENIRVRVTPEQKQRLAEYAERHYQSMSGVVCQALDLLYAREEQQNNKEYGKEFMALCTNSCSKVGLISIAIFISKGICKNNEKRN